MSGTTPTTHTARKRHMCDACCQPIEPGQTYERTRWYDVRAAWTTRLHVECAEVVSWWYDTAGCDDEWYCLADAYDEGRRMRAQEGR